MDQFASSAQAFPLDAGSGHVLCTPPHGAGTSPQTMGKRGQAMLQLQVFYFSLLRWLRHVRLLSRWYRYSEAEPEDMKRSLLFFSFRSTKNRFSCENEPAAEKYQAASFARKSSPSICVQADTLHQQKPRSFWQRADQLFTKSVPACTSSACSTTAAGFVAGVAGKCLMR